MILSDRTIRELLAEGKIVIDPLDPQDIQPSSVDLHLDDRFRVFLNHTQSVIDVKQDQTDLTEEVEVGTGDALFCILGNLYLSRRLSESQFLMI